MKNKKGFTLVELLAVIAILAILVIIALPNILELYNNARKNAFLREVHTICNSAKQKYIATSFSTTVTKQIYTNVGGDNKLNIQGGTGNFNYYVVVDTNGKVIELKVSNGTYKYEKNGNIEKPNIADVSLAEEGYSVITPSILFVNRQNEKQITAGDEVKINNEHFYVISSNNDKTVLLAKYNLLVGDVIEKIDGSWTITKTLNASDSGYGLQSSSAKGYYSGTTKYTGVVAFSAKGYWDNSNCILESAATSPTCSGTPGLKGKYSNESNAEGKTGTYLEPYPFVYESSMSGIQPNIYYYSSTGGALDNGYTIAYYVEQYVNTLKNNGAPSNIKGRLLKFEEAKNLSSTVKGNWSYWLGSAASNNYVMYNSGSKILANGFWLVYRVGLRPVIVVSTYDVES